MPSGSDEIYVHAAAFYVSCLKNGYIDEAQEFADWYLDTFDVELPELEELTDRA